MKNTTLPLTLTRCCQLLLMLIPSHGMAQTTNAWSEPEEKLATILLQDTLSHTVSYLPKGYWFGLPDRSHGKLVLLKDGPRNYLLRDGTHQVHLLENNNGKPQARRLDSSVFAGDNFLMMAFMRKDTIYQYGGYGFWNTRDFFMRYRASNRDWDFLTGGNGLPNELNYHYYDPASDAFYVIGSFSSSHHPFARKILVDSVFKYDFSTRRWTSLGKIRDDFNDLDSSRNDNMSFCFTPFGFLDCRTFAVKLYDIPNNRILEPKEQLIDKLLNFGRDDRLFDEQYRQFILLRDTLHLLMGRFDTVRYDRMHVTLNDFNQHLPQPIFKPISSSLMIGLDQHGGILLSTILPLVGLAGALLYWNRKRKKNKAAPHLYKHQETIGQASLDMSQDQTDASGQADIHSPVPVENDTAFFLTQLNPTELALLDMLLKETLAGNTTDTQAINKTLGVSSKDASLQKARRSISINNINSCFRQTFKEEDNLIIRERDGDDKRAFVYRLDSRFIDRINI
jgi:hypothetical protein